MVDIKPLKLANGMKLRNGQLIPSYNIARDGAAKHIRTPEIVHGQRNRTAELSGMSGFSHPLDDEKLEKNWMDKGNVPVHSATPSRAQRGQRVDGSGSDMLRSASRLGQKPNATQGRKHHGN
jgi:hypothetical protein